MNLISCRKACFAYEGKTVVENLTFNIQEGEYICVVGENGSGKSTLIKGLLHLIRPASGSVEYAKGLVPSDIGYLPQKTEIQNDFPASVWEVVSSGCRDGFPFLSQKSRSLAKEKLKMLSIWNLRRCSFMDLSGGQQQRVLLARALCSTKKLLLLDEPVAGLDPVITREMYELIDKLHKKENLTILMISHDICGAIAYADKVLHMDHALAFFGTPEEYCHTNLGQAFSGGKFHVHHV